MTEGNINSDKSYINVSNVVTLGRRQLIEFLVWHELLNDYVLKVGQICWKVLIAKRLESFFIS